MSRHNYTNPAFCQDSEFYPVSNSSSPSVNKNVFVRKQRSASMRSISRNAHNGPQMQIQLRPAANQQQTQHRIQQRELPPKPGPKPQNVIKKMPEQKITSPAMQEGYALVPLAELPRSSKGRYAVLPANEARLRLSKSQDDLDRISHNFLLDNEEMDEDEDEEAEESFMSLPAISEQENIQRKIAAAFSTDFVNKSMILVDQTNLQRYAVVPTDDDEELVDSNHEIIQMHNGRAHRYAVIPTEEEETCLSGEFETNSVHQSFYGSVKSVRNAAIKANVSRNIEYAKHRLPTNVKQNMVQPNQQQSYNQNQNQMQMQMQMPIQRQPGTPTKNPIATQKLHELLSTPRKSQSQQLQRQASYHTIVQKSPERRYRSQMLCNPSNDSDFQPQKLQYDLNQAQTTEKRSTAIISPRLQQSVVYSDTTMSSSLDKTIEKTWSNDSFQKIASATATIGVVSLMLLLTGFMNSGLCLYIVTVVSF